MKISIWEIVQLEKDLKLAGASLEKILRKKRNDNDQTYTKDLKGDSHSIFDKITVTKTEYTTKGDISERVVEITIIKENLIDEYVIPGHEGEDFVLIQESKYYIKDNKLEVMLYKDNLPKR